MKIRALGVFFTLSIFSSAALTAPSDPGPKLPDNYVACKSAEEFEKSIAYFRSEKSLGLNDKQIVTWSLVIAKGCSGASERFKKVFDLFTKSGVDLRKTVELAASFSKKTAEQTNAFAGLFKVFFLDNYFDLDFMTAYELSVKLSENPAKSEFARRDFEKLYKFCTGQDKLMLPFKACAQYSLNLLKHYDLYPEGIFPFFESSVMFLTSKTGAVLNIKEAMEITQEILAYGPLAPETFKRGYNYSVDKKGLDTSFKQGMKVGLELAKISLKELNPEVADKENKDSRNSKDPKDTEIKNFKEENRENTENKDNKDNKDNKNIVKETTENKK
ncbi:MAG: hypothetical protein ACXVCR_05990 [Bdellovibrio sp.]